MSTQKAATKDPLFDLIKSLNASEKAYFKKYVQGDEESNFLKLFDAMNAMGEYEEEKLVKKFKGEKFIRNMAVSKNYLFESIMDSLRAYHRNKSVALKAENTIGNLRILYEKGLTTIFEKQLEKAKVYAEENELTFHYLEMLELERPHNYNKTKSNIEIQKKIERQLLLAMNKNRIAVVNEKLLNWIYKNEKVKTKEEKLELEKLMEDPVCHEAIENFNFSGRNSFHSAWSFYYYALGDFEKCVEKKELQLTNYIDHPVLKKANEKYFLLVLGNLLSMCYTAKNESKFEKYFQFMLKEHAVTKENENIIEEQFLAFTILHYKLSSLAAEGAAFVTENEERIISGLDKFSLIRQIDICYNSAIFFFKLKDYKSSLKWINLILNNKNLDDREFMHCYSRIIQLILHYELNNEELVNSLLRSTYRYLAKRNRIHDFEEAMLRSMQKIIKVGGGKATLGIFSDLKKELEEIYADPYKKNSMDHFDYIEWLNDKLNVNTKK
jgi:hypothetical protein